MMAYRILRTWQSAFSTDTLLETGSEGFQRFTGLLSNQGKKYKLLFHSGSFKKKVLSMVLQSPVYAGSRLHKVSS